MPNYKLKYINVLSNQPLQILKQLTGISERLSRNSSSEITFKESKHQYEDALRKVVLKVNLVIETQQHLPTKK